jgi:hypothetical protein
MIETMNETNIYNTTDALQLFQRAYMGATET